MWLEIRHCRDAERRPINCMIRTNWISADMLLARTTSNLQFCYQSLLTYLPATGSTFDTVKQLGIGSGKVIYHTLYCKHEIYRTLIPNGNTAE
ncbi:hypothetical protein L873DRAFT_77030 [Choiromyces venosus 120613-1]|uniref:Uncharacterized protein n=1 Tax=Choiromyces venosus 120613-1 TaxID=1336337 RepID=A0A3N4J7K3_9PEZI|nr:hypothetical protein L873DRAFT_77030 [Choiromyces venosus 120613-1]